jgi:putative ABC transport system permease protein
VTAIDRKLLREVWQHRTQMLSIAAVVAVGMMTVLTMRGTYDSLVTARDLYYRAARFPDVWAPLKRAPDSLIRRLREIPGVGSVDTRVTFTATLDLPGLGAPGLGRFVSIPERRRSMLGDLFIKRGRYIAPGRPDEILISDKFAQANALGPGNTLRAVINGRFRELSIVGTAISPEHSYAVPPGALFPDDKRYGVIWMGRDAIAPAYDMKGSFNEVVLTLTPRANRRQVEKDLDLLLSPYGGIGAFGREDQLSNHIIDGELEQNRTMGTAVPLVFLGIASFLLNIVLGRLIATQRNEIAVLKAFGYTNLEIGRHYLLFAMAAVLVGALFGAFLGIRLGQGSVNLYGVYFDFPVLEYKASGALVVLSTVVSILAAGAGAMGAVLRATRLQPAEAMRPEPPATFQGGILERLGLFAAIPSSGRMILRNLERRPLRAAFSSLGVAFSVAILVVGMFMFDGIDHMMDLQFRVAQREDLSVTFNEPRSGAARHDLANLPGVGRVEVFRSAPARLRSGHRSRTVAITGMEAESRLRRIVNEGGDIIEVPTEGLIISAALSSALGIRKGDAVEVEVLEGERRSARVRVAGVVRDSFGLSAYMRLDRLQRLIRGERSISGAFLAVARGERAGLNLKLKQMPAIAGVASPAQMLESFQKQLADSLYISVFFILGFSGVIAIAVLYNGARIALSERARELASLRVLGFSRGEVAVLLFGEQAVVTLFALPLGCLLGYGLSALILAGINSETYRVPLLISGKTYAYSMIATVVAALASGWIVRQRLDRIDLVSVLKTRE